MLGEASIGDLVSAGVMSIGDGYRTKQSELRTSGFRMIRVADVKGGQIALDSPDFVSAEFGRQIGAKAARVGDVLLTTKGTVGRVAVVPELNGEAVYSPQLCWFRVHKHGVLDHRFFSFWLSSAEFIAQASYLQSNTDMAPYISLSDLQTISIALPPLPKQQAIAEVLGALDDKIAANTALAATAEATIATAYIAAMRGDAVEKSLLDELVIEFGEPFGGAQFSEPGLGRPLIRIRDLKTFKSQVWSTESRPREVVVTAGDVLVGMDAEFRATPWLGEAGLLNQRVLRARHATFGRALVREMLRRPLAEVESEKSATTVIHLNKADLARKTVDVPNADSLTSFERLAEPLYEARVALAAENRTLAATRDALLPQLMSGKLRVRDAEAAASEAGA